MVARLREARWQAGLILGLLVALQLLLFWQVRDTPLQPYRLLRIDAPAVFWGLLATLGTLALLLKGEANPWRLSAAALLLALAPLSTYLPILPGALLAALLLAGFAPRLPAGQLLGLLALTGALIGLWLNSGTPSYTAREAGTGVNSLIFWLLLLAVICGCGLPPLLSPSRGARAQRLAMLFAPAWIYPLVRLYSLGPWNAGWGFAAALLGGAAALWAGLGALRASDTDRDTWIWSGQHSLALIGLSLSTSAGLASCCYALLVLPPLLFLNQARRGLPLLLLSAAWPFSAAFIATWMSFSAAAVGGALALGGIVWLLALFNALALLLGVARRGSTLQNRAAAWPAASAALLLGVCAPPLVWLLIAPVVNQLQGGLTPFGETSVYPWIGLAALDSARRTLAVQPSILLAGLMLVLAALAHLLARLLSSGVAPEPAQAEALGDLIDDVPWLAWLLDRHRR